MFDGFVTEIKFWCSGDPTDAINSRAHNKMSVQEAHCGYTQYAVYLGHASQPSLPQLVESGLVDLMIFHCYVKSPTVFLMVCVALRCSRGPLMVCVALRCSRGPLMVCGPSLLPWPFDGNAVLYSTNGGKDFRTSV